MPILFPSQAGPLGVVSHRHTKFREAEPRFCCAGPAVMEENPPRDHAADVMGAKQFTFYPDSRNKDNSNQCW